MGHERFSLGLNGATSVRASLEAGLLAAKDAGFSFYEPRIPTLADCEERGCRERAVESLHETGLSWLALNALEGVFELAPDRLLARGEEIFSLAGRFNVRQVIAVPGKGRPSHADAQRLLTELGKRAAEHGISLLYEFIGFPEHALACLEEAHDVAAAIGLPLVLDTFHLAVSRTDPARIATLSSRRDRSGSPPRRVDRGKDNGRDHGLRTRSPWRRGIATGRLREGDLEHGICWTVFRGGLSPQVQAGRSGNGCQGRISPGKQIARDIPLRSIAFSIVSIEYA